MNSKSAAATPSAQLIAAWAVFEAKHSYASNLIFLYGPGPPGKYIVQFVTAHEIEAPGHNYHLVSASDLEVIELLSRSLKRGPRFIELRRNGLAFSDFVGRLEGASGLDFVPHWVQ